MRTIDKARVTSTLIGLFVIAPIWFYLLYRLLEAAQATPVMWLLYWVYVPAAIFVRALTDLWSDR